MHCKQAETLTKKIMQVPRLLTNILQHQKVWLPRAQCA